MTDSVDSSTSNDPAMTNGSVVDMEGTTRFLFGCDFDSDDFDPDGNEAHSITADNVRASYPWRQVYDSWTQYLTKHCPTAASVINWENLFWYYGGQEFPVDDPYPFLGYLLYRTATPEGCMVSEEAMTILDSIAMDMLERIGDVTIDTVDYYGANTDPRVLASAAAWRKKLGPADLSVDTAGTDSQ